MISWAFQARGLNSSSADLTLGTNIAPCPRHVVIERWHMPPPFQLKRLFVFQASQRNWCYLLVRKNGSQLNFLSVPVRSSLYFCVNHGVSSNASLVFQDCGKLKRDKTRQNYFRRVSYYSRRLTAVVTGLCTVIVDLGMTRQNSSSSGA